MKICNVKFSLKVQWDLSFNTDGTGPPFCSRVTASRYPNFWVVKDRRYTFIIFVGKKGLHHVNVTRVPDLDHVPSAREDFEACFTSSPTVIQPPSVDNLTCLSQASGPLDLFHVHQRVLAQPPPGLERARFNLEQFPGLFLKFKNPNGTLLLFSSGKIVIVGCRLTSTVQDLLQRLHGAGLFPPLPGGRSP